MGHLLLAMGAVWIKSISVTLDIRNSQKKHRGKASQSSRITVINQWGHRVL
jgi:hypothetical protein